MKKILLLTLFYFAFVGCTSVSTLHDATVLEKGKFKNTLSFGMYGTKINADGSTGAAGDVGDTISVPQFEYMLRYGINEKFDIGLRTSLWSYGIDLKYSLGKKEDSAMAVGAGLVTSNVEVKSGGSETDISIMDLVVPFYYNHVISAEFTLYVVPKAIIRSVSGGTEDINETIMGISLGGKYGSSESGFLGEVTFLSAEDAITQFNVGYYF